MTALSLVPYAARLRWSFATAQAADQWQALVATFLEDLAAACVAGEMHVIGHIKALALLPDGGFLRASTISARHPADVAIERAGDRPCSELELALNVLVYGLAWTEAHRLVQASAQQVAKDRGAVVEQLTPSPGPGAAADERAHSSHIHQE